jgi:hypothetical protein
MHPVFPFAVLEGMRFAPRGGVPVQPDVGVEAACVPALDYNVRKHLLQPGRLPQVLRKPMVVQRQPPVVPQGLTRNYAA